MHGHATVRRQRAELMADVNNTWDFCMKRNFEMIAPVN